MRRVGQLSPSAWLRRSALESCLALVVCAAVLAAAGDLPVEHCNAPVVVTEQQL